MSELANFPPRCDTGETFQGSESDWLNPDIDLTDGRYRDPDVNQVKWINDKFQDIDKNVEITLIKAFETAGIIKPLKETLKPLERNGLMSPEVTRPGIEHSDFTEKREKQLLEEFLTNDAATNQLLNDIRRLTPVRRDMNEFQMKQLIEFRKDETKGGRAMPPTLQVLTVMLGIRKPEAEDAGYISGAPEETIELAPDIYTLMLLEQRLREGNVSLEPTSA